MKMMNESQMLPCLPSLFTRSEGWMDGWLVGWMGYSCMLRILFSGPIQIRFLIRNGFFDQLFLENAYEPSLFVWRRRRSKALEIVGWGDGRAVGIDACLASFLENLKFCCYVVVGMFASAINYTIKQPFNSML